MWEGTDCQGLAKWKACEQTQLTAIGGKFVFEYIF